MPNSWPTIRTVIHSKEWEESVKNFRGNSAPPALIDQIEIGIDFVLASVPHEYPEVDGTDIRVLNVHASGSLPALNAFFRIVDENEVECLRLELREQQFGEEDDTGDEFDGECF